MSYRKIGIVGAGTIGRSIFDAIAETGQSEVTFVLVQHQAEIESAPAELARLMTTDPEVALARQADLVVEAAHANVLKALAPRILASSDLCAFSSTALADRALERTITEIALSSGTKLLIPHGAILALDGLADGREGIDDVVITTTKSNASLGLDGPGGVVFDGTTREVCQRFPRNVNVHAAIAIAGIGFDRTRSVVVADPETRQMRHRIEVRGRGFSWDISVSSEAAGQVSGRYTALSAKCSIKRIIDRVAINFC